jgi:hypothetical protein
MLGRARTVGRSRGPGEAGRARLVKHLGAVRVFARRARSMGEQGMTTAEYAVGTMAAVAFAGLLLAIVRSGPVKNALTKLIMTALGTGS